MRIECSRSENALAEAGDLAVFMQRLKPSARDLRNLQPYRVGSDIYGSERRHGLQEYQQNAAIFETMSSAPANPPSASRTGQARGEDSGQRTGLLVLWGIVLLGAVLRLIGLGHKSFWLDEIASVAISRRPAPVFWHFLWHDEGNMALYYVLLKPWLHFGYGEGAVRMLSVLAGVLCIPMMYCLGRRLLGAKTGVLTALLMALSTCAISVSQEARAYSLVVLMVLLSTYVFVQLVEEPSYKVALTYALVAGLTCYFHYFGVLVPIAHAITIAALKPQNRPWKQLFPAWFVTALLAAPILWLMHAQDVGHISWLQPPSWLEVYHLGVFLAADGGKSVGAVLFVLELILAGVALGKWSRGWGGEHDDWMRWRYALIISSVAIPIIVTLLVSIVRPAFYHRFLIVCLPGWLLMVASGARSVPSRIWRNAAIGAVCGLSLATTILLYMRETEDWRGAEKYLISNTRPGDRVLYYDSVGQFAGENYRDWLQPRDAARPATTGISRDDVNWFDEVGKAERVWLVLYRAQPGEAAAQEIEHRLAERYVLADQGSFARITVVEYIAK